MTTLNPLIDGMMKVARLAAAAQCANAPEGTAPSAQVHAEGFEQALRVLRAACPLPFEKVPCRFRKCDSERDRFEGAIRVMILSHDRDRQSAVGDDPLTVQVAVGAPCRDPSAAASAQCPRARFVTGRT